MTEGWVERTFGVAFDGADGLVELGLRHNPRRAQLLVSTVLGKHIPADPRAVHRTGLELGRRVRDVLDGEPAVVLGFAETATGLGHCVAEALAAPYLHSTRRREARPAFAGFTEEHSHATDHQLVPSDPGLLTRGDALVLVDDELSTGRTALNTIRALHKLAPHRRYVLAALLDVRDDASGATVDQAATRLGVPIDVVSLARRSIRWPRDFAARVEQRIAALVPARLPTSRDAVVRVHDGLWPSDVPTSGRYGYTPADGEAARNAARTVADAVAPLLETLAVLVLGTEELMYTPLLIALELATRITDVRFSSTTRSPVAVIDEPGYPIRSGLTFASYDDPCDGPGPRFAYNVAGSFDRIVLVVDANNAELRTGLVAQLRSVCDDLHVVVLPSHDLPAPLRGPRFGSYAADEVGWLLTDLSAFALEAPTEEREEAVQSGGAHYSESLPIEYQPSAEYRLLYEQALDESARRIAQAVGVVTELVLAERGRAAVLASLARAGTPIGILMRRWARFAHGLDLPHYAVSIVRGRGIDEIALRYLAEHHDPSDVVFVDGWTGKGAIARELASAVDDANALLGTAFDPALAVLADPGSCVATFGTRDDFLVPSACLNSTVSGLVSRTVRNDTILRPHQFDGAKFYRELAADDVSARFLDAVSGCFESVAADVAGDWPRIQVGDRQPTWAGWAQVEALSVEYGIGDVTLVKPGVGETTRVLLRRVPWAVLMRTGEDVAHVRLLAVQRGVPVWDVDNLAYRCVGLIHPRYTRGATGADGRGVLAR